jgi:hypothetical protein
MKNQNEFYNLSLRYNILGPSDGLFLSIDHDVYSYLYNGSKLPVVECYASPFNNNLPHYCSIYERDYIYGSLGKYKDYITRLTQPTRLILNPPYTNRMIDECINLLLEYMDRCNGDFFLMLPLMYNYEPTERLLSYRNTFYKLLESNSYTIEDYSKNISILTPMNIIIVANIANNKELSQKCVDDISKILETKADILKAKNKIINPWHVMYDTDIPEKNISAPK